MVVHRKHVAARGTLTASPVMPPAPLASLLTIRSRSLLELEHEWILILAGIFMRLVAVAGAAFAVDAGNSLAVRAEVALRLP